MSGSKRRAQFARLTHAKSCENHPKSLPDVVCYTCNDSFLCYDCLASGEHRGHEYVKISKFVELKKQSISRHIKEAREKEIKIKSKIQDAKEIKKSHASNNDAMSKIQAQKEILISLITKVADNLQKKTSLSKQNYTDELSNYIEQQETHLSELSLCREKAEVDHRSVSDLEFIEIVDKLSFYTEKSELSCVENKTFKISERPVNESEIVNLFGILSTIICHDQGGSNSGSYESNKTDNSDITNPASNSTVAPAVPPKKQPSSVHDVTEIRLFMFPHRVDRICPVGPHDAWIVHRVDDECQNNINRVNIDGEITNTVTLDTEVTDVTTTPGGDLLVCCWSDRSVRKIVKQSSVILFHCEGSPLAIRVTNKGDVIASLNDEGVVVKYTMTGQKLTTSDKSGNKQAVTRPDKLAVCNKTGRVAVVANGTPYSVVVMDSDLNVVFTYKGDTTSKSGHVVPHWSGQKFIPNDVTFDSEGHLLVADAYDTVIMVDTDGHFVRSDVTVKGGPDLFAVSLHESGKLWLGYDNGMIKVFDY